MRTLRTAVAILTLGGVVSAQESIRMVVLSGQGSANTREGRAPNIRLRVEDNTGKPIENASVTALLPAMGAGGTFGFGTDTIDTRSTDSDGNVEFGGIRLRRLAGEFPIKLTARKGNAVTTATIQQTAKDSELPKERMFSPRRIALYAIIGGGVAAGVAVATYNAKPATQQQGFSVTPGNPALSGTR